MASRGRAHDLAHQAGLDQLVRVGVAVRGRVHDQGQVFRAAIAQRADQDVGKTGAAEARYEDRRAVRHIGERLGRGRGTLVDRHCGLRLPSFMPAARSSGRHSRIPSRSCATQRRGRKPQRAGDAAPLCPAQAYLIQINAPKSARGQKQPPGKQPALRVGLMASAGSEERTAFAEVMAVVAAVLCAAMGLLVMIYVPGSRHGLPRPAVSGGGRHRRGRDPEQVVRSRAPVRGLGRLHGRPDQGRHDRRRVLGHRRLRRRRLHRLAAGLSRAEPRPALDQLRPPAPAAHLGGDLRLRRQRAARHLVLCRAAHLPRAPAPAAGRPGSCSGATSSSSSSPAPATCSASPRARNTPSPSGTPTCG